MCMHLCFCVNAQCVQVFFSICAHAEARVDAQCLPHHSPLSSLTQELSLLELTLLARLASQWAGLQLRISSSSPKLGLQMCALMSFGFFFLSACCCLFGVTSGDPDSGPHVCPASPFLMEPFSESRNSFFLMPTFLACGFHLRDYCAYNHHTHHRGRRKKGRMSTRLFPDSVSLL